MRFRRYVLPALALVLMPAAPLRAERYALLIGVGRYLNGIHGLDGPSFDVAALRTVLLGNGYRPGAVATLMDEQATRPKIVEMLGAMVARLHSGDHFLLYYSGHGTSAFDRNLQWLSPAIGPDSGALATYDLSLTSLSAAAETLVIGRRDLRPILSKIPEGAEALIVLDACYSENSAKSISIFRSAPVRGINLVEAIQKQKGQQAGSAGRPAAAAPAAADEGGAYPYSNVVALSAASKDQPAIDINAETMVNRPAWRTVDGKPHGALTNALLDALLGHADTNHDGAISYDELFRYVRRQMEKFPHQPQLLSALAFPLDQPALGAVTTNHSSPGTPAGTPPASGPTPPPTPVAPNHPPSSGAAPAPPPASSDRLRVAIQGSPLEPELESKLRKSGDIEIVTGPFDLLLRKEGPNWALYDPSGVLTQKLPSESPDAIASRVQAQARVLQLKSWSTPRQTFNVRIDAEPQKATSYDRLRTVFRVGENITFRIATERPAYLLLLDMDKDGRVTVLFPGPPPKERGLQPARQPVEFAVTATLPAGSEQLKLIGFPQQPPEWADWTCSANSCPSFSAADPQMSRLMQMLNRTPGGAEASLRIVTQQ
jgi:hypothetical protein